MVASNPGEPGAFSDASSYQVAWPSFCHTSAHWVGATLSPNHWCASSCTMIGW